MTVSVVIGRFILKEPSLQVDAVDRTVSWSVPAMYDGHDAEALRTCEVRRA